MHLVIKNKRYVVRSGRLCFTSLALLWTRGISLRGTTPRGVTFYGLSAERAVTRFIFDGNPCIVSVPLEGRYGQDRVGRSTSPHALSLSCPDESLKAVSDLHERDGQRANTLRGSDTTHPTASLS